MHTFSSIIFDLDEPTLSSNFCRWIGCFNGKAYFEQDLLLDVGKQTVAYLRAYRGDKECSYEIVYQRFLIEILKCSIKQLIKDQLPDLNFDKHYLIDSQNEMSSAAEVYIESKNLDENGDSLFYQDISSKQDIDLLITQLRVKHY